MTAQHAIARSDAVRLTSSSFLLLRGFGAFDAYWKVELLDGELWGVPANDGEEPDTDDEFPIKLTIDHYELLDRSGAFASYSKTELIDGKIYAMSPQHRPHGFVKDELAYRLRRALEEIGSDLHVATEQSLAIAPFSEPQPDIVLTREPIGKGGIPVASVALIVEVSDSTAAFDRKQKALMYAAADVPEYWIADINRRVIRQLWQPVRGTYAQRRDVPFGESVTSSTLTNIAVPTATL